MVISSFLATFMLGVFHVHANLMWSQELVRKILEVNTEEEEAIKTSHQRSSK